MKYFVTAVLEAGDLIRLYDQDRDRGPATVIKAGPYREKEDTQRLVVQLGAEQYELDGRIESKCEAAGYDRVPVLAVWYA